MGSMPIPAFTALVNAISDQVTHHALGHCQLVTKSTLCKYTTITTNGGCVTAFEIVGMNRFLTPETERSYLQSLSDSVSDVLRVPHHKVGISYVRDRNRNKTTLEDIFSTTTDTIKNLGYEAAHFFEDQIRDLSQNCSYERTILYVVTDSAATRKDSLTHPQYLGKDSVIGDMPRLAQNTFVESKNIVQVHQAFCKTLNSALEDSITLEKLTADRYLQIVKEEEENISLEQTGWRTKGVGDPTDFSLSDTDDDFVAYPPLAYQLVTNNKRKAEGDSTIIESNSRYIATIDRDTFPITPLPFNNLLRSISPHIPLRITFEFETGTEDIMNRLNSRKTWLLLLLFSKQSRQIRSALDELMNYVDKQNGTLLGGTLSVATWAYTLYEAQEYKREITQAITAWGSPSVNSPTSEFAAYSGSLPAFSRKQSARVCVQPLPNHITTSPLTRPTAPMKAGGICMSSLDGRLFPIDSSSSEQPYSLNVITGAMGSGKTVFSSVFNNTFLFGKGSVELPLMSYCDFGSGVHNYLASVKSWLPSDQHYKVELIRFINKQGNAFNILEPQFGLNQLEEQEFAFVSAMICRIVNGNSTTPVHPKLTTVVDDIVREFFIQAQRNPMQYQARIAEYTNNENRLHTEINELLADGTITVPDNKVKTWYLIRDELFQLGKKFFDHARFCHRQGSPNLSAVANLCYSSTNLRSTYEPYKTENGDELIQYIRLSIQSLMGRFQHIFSKASQIDISQARIIGVDLKGVAGNGADEETIATKRLFAMLGKYVAEKNFWRDPEDFMKLVPQLYKDMYRRIIAIDSASKKHSFMDEYKQMKSPEMDALTDNTALIARKYGMCMTLSSQSPMHIPIESLKLASNLYILKMTQEDAQYLQKTYHLSDSFINHAQRVVGMSSGFGRTILYMGQFNNVKGVVVQLLRNHITPSYLWNFASDSTDELLKEAARLRFGVKDAYRRLASLFPSGSAKSELDRRIKNSKFDARSLTTEEVILEFTDQLAHVQL